MQTVDFLDKLVLCLGLPAIFKDGSLGFLDFFGSFVVLTV